MGLGRVQLLDVQFVARHEAGETSGESSCFGADSEWWTEKAMFTAGPGLKVADGDGEDKVGFVFMENECNTGKRRTRGCNQAAKECRTKNCLVEPAYVASYAPYGRATVTGTWQYTPAKPRRPPSPRASSSSTSVNSSSTTRGAAAEGRRQQP